MVESIILFSKTIKPSSPTPSSLRHHKFSVLDHFGTPAYAPIAAFYSKPTDHNHNISQILENSFSKVLASYYPFAGRLIDENSYVDCNDTGVEYLNVRINCPMNGVLNNPYNDTIDVVFPRNLPWNRSFKGNLLVAQLSHFDCGGLAVSVAYHTNLLMDIVYVNSLVIEHLQLESWISNHLLNLTRLLSSQYYQLMIFHIHLILYLNLNDACQKDTISRPLI